MPNNDYIKRSDAIRVIEYYEPNYTKEDEIHMAAMMIRIDQIPAADVEPVRHGWWIDENPASPLDPRMRCSVCGHIDIPIVRWRFCPMCGAKMDVKPPKEERDD